MPTDPRPAPGPAAAFLRSLAWPLAALGLLLAFNLAFTPNFFAIEVRDGHLYGTLIDILNHGSKVMLLALGMTLVIATGGVDLSVGAVMAMAGATAVQLIAGPGWSMPAAVAAALGLSLVAGRGIAQLITDGSIITFTDGVPAFASLERLGNGHLLGLPFPVAVVLGMLGLTALLTRRTAVGLFIEAVGDNEQACRLSGLDPRLVRFLSYLFAGLCAGIAGLVAASNIKCADANHAGLFLELDAILAVVVGGTALTGGRFRLVGSMIGALLIQTLTTTMYMRNVSSDIAPVPKALVIIVVCLLQSPEFRAAVARPFRRKEAL